MNSKIMELLDGERKYQDTRWDNDPDTKRQKDKEKVVADWLTYMEEHLKRAKLAVYNLNPLDAMGEVRKITALGVAAMENLDTPFRSDVWEGVKTK